MAREISPQAQELVNNTIRRVIPTRFSEKQKRTKKLNTIINQTKIPTITESLQSIDPSLMTELPTHGMTQLDKNTGGGLERFARSFFNEQEIQEISQAKDVRGKIKFGAGVRAGGELLSRIITTSSVLASVPIQFLFSGITKEKESSFIFDANKELSKDILMEGRQPINEAAQTYLQQRKVGIYGGNKVEARDITTLIAMGFVDLIGHPVFFVPLKKIFSGIKKVSRTEPAVQNTIQQIEKNLAKPIESATQKEIAQELESIFPRGVKDEIQALSPELISKKNFKTPKLKVEPLKAKKPINKGQKVVFRDIEGNTTKGTVRSISKNVARVETSQGIESISARRVQPIPLTEQQSLSATRQVAPVERLVPVVGKLDIEAIVKESQIIKQLQDNLNVPVRQGKFQEHALGIFKPGEEVIRLKRGGVPVVSHEAGHFIEGRTPAIKPAIKQFDNELLPIATKGRKGSKFSEGFAEFTRLYVTNPKEAQRVAPGFFPQFENILKGAQPKFLEALKIAQRDYQRFLKLPSTSKIFSKMSVQPEVQDGFSFKKLYTQAIDDLNPLKEYVDLAKAKGIKLEADQDPYILARLLRGWVGKANVFLTHATFPKKFWSLEKGSVVPVLRGKGLQQILRPLEPSLNEFRTYLISRRAIELNQRNIATGITLQDAKLAIKELETVFPQFKKATEDIFRFQDDVLKYLFESGNLSRATFIKIKKLNKNYVPFYRVVDEVMRAGGYGKNLTRSTNALKRIKGSELEIVDPLESIIKNTYALINAAERNSVNIAFVRLSRQNSELGRLVEKVPLSQARVAKVSLNEIFKKAFKDVPIPDEIKPLLDSTAIDIFRPSFIEDNNIITVLINGKRQAYQVEKNLFQALQGSQAGDFGILGKIFEAPTRLLRAGAILSPEFSFRNPVRDQMTAFLQSKYGYTPGVDGIRGIFSLFKKTDDYLLWNMSGGTHSMLVSMDRRYLQKNLQELISKSKLPNIVRHPIESLRILSELGESATRLGEFSKGLKKGATPLQAGFASREVTLDFARVGSKTQALNRTIAFFNANLQGTDKFIRMHKNNPILAARRGIELVTIPTILLYLANRDDPRYQELPRWQKDLFWIIPTDKHIWRIPKPFTWGIVYGTMVERTLEYIEQKDPEIITQLFTDWQESPFLTGLSPGFIPTAMLPIIENITNHSLFLNRPVVPKSLEQLEKEEQYSLYTSEIAKALGRATNQSPLKIDNLLRGYTAGLGRHATNVIDSVLLNMGIVPDIFKPTPTLEDRPIIKAFMAKDPILSGQSDTINKFYDLWDESQIAKNTFNEFIERGEVQKAKEYQKKHPEMFLAQGTQGIASNLSELRKIREFTQRNKKLSQEDKEEAIQNIHYQMWFIAKQFMDVVKQSKLLN